MRILHISNVFATSKVHTNLYRELDGMGVEQIVFCPIRIAQKELIGKNEFEASHTKFVYAPVIKSYHRYVYHIKQQRIFRELRKKISLNDIDLCHAATLLTDGAQAYRLFKKKHIPYIVAVRSTDYYAFLLKAPHTRPLAKKILLNASKIVFVSPALKEKFCKHPFINRFIAGIEGKIIVSRNGIDDYWIDSVNRKNVPDNHSILYVGTMIRRKRPLVLIEAVLALKEKYPDLKLNLIGSTGEDEEAVKEYAKKYPETVVYHGRINDKQKLLDHYRNNSLFTLPSTGETFGLVYLEALSQNLPVIYTKGDGIDGLLPDNSGVGLITPNVDNIKDAIEKVFDSRDHYSNMDIDFELFRWSNIAAEYSKIYLDILRNKTKKHYVQISLSFDDSRRDFYTNVLPLLKKYNVPATLNVITARVEKSDPNNADRQYMTVAEVQECAASGLVEIASHSANHRNDKDDIILSINRLNDWLLCNYMRVGGYASPFSELTLNNSKEKGIYELIETGQLRYIRSGTRTRREGMLFAAAQYFNQYLHSPLLYRLMNRKYVINKLQAPFLPSVAIHRDTTVSMVQHFVSAMADNESEVFCLHGILHPGEKDYAKRFNWDYDRFDAFLKFLKSDSRYKVVKTVELVQP